MSLYRYLPPADVAALSERDRAAYTAERARFDAEVARLIDDANRTGVLDLGGGMRWHLRCRGTAGASPCLQRRGHRGDCSPVWGA